MLVVKPCLTLCDPMDYSPPGSSVQGVLQARILIRVHSHSLLRGIFLTRRSNPGLLHCRQIVHHLSHQGECSENPGPHQSELPVEQDRFWGLFVVLFVWFVGFFISFFFFFFFLAVLGIHCCVLAFSSCVKLGLLFSGGARASHCSGFSSCRARL